MKRVWICEKNNTVQTCKKVTELQLVERGLEVDLEVSGFISETNKKKRGDVLFDEFLIEGME